jgi:hypothetical protein
MLLGLILSDVMEWTLSLQVNLVGISSLSQ